MDKDLFDKAMLLSPNEKVVFAELILASVDNENDEVRVKWIDEVKNRIEAVNQGKAKLLDFDDLYNEG